MFKLAPYFWRFRSVVKYLGFKNTAVKLFQYIFKRRVASWNMIREVITDANGLEIGGPSPLFKENGMLPIYLAAGCVDNCNFAVNTSWEGKIDPQSGFSFCSGKSHGQQFIGDGGKLDWIADEKYDFVLSCHSIEHLANPIGGLLAWKRVMKESGILVCVFPHFQNTFDRKRNVTPLSHMIADWENHTGNEDDFHFGEIIKLHDLSKDPAMRTRARLSHSIRNNSSLRLAHHHVFDTMSAVELINHVGFQILSVEAFLPYNILVIARKTHTKHIDNSEFLANAPQWRKNSPFSRDFIKLQRNLLGKRASFS